MNPFAVSFALVILLCSQASAQTSDVVAVDAGAIVSLSTIHKQPFFIEVMMASVIGWIIGITKGFSTSRDWLSAYVEDVPVFFVFCLDLMIFVVVGAYIGTGVYQPANFVAALGAGVTWPVALGALASKPSPVRGGGPDV